MTPPRRAASWRRYLRFWGADVRADVQDELQFHIDMRAREYEAQGMTAADARRAALERFGDVARVDATLQSHDQQREHTYRGRAILAATGLDLRYALRTLRRAPAFTAAAVLCLGLGTGATAAVFAVVDDLLFRPLAVAHPADLVVVGTISSGTPLPGDNSYQNYLDIRGLHAVFADAAASVTTAVNLRFGDRTVRHMIQAVSENYWPMLGVPMIQGRAFTPAEAEAHSRLIVISYRLWKGALASAPDVVGRELVMDGLPMTIVGVAPPTFQGTQPEISEDGWVPVTLLHDLDPASPDPLTRRGGGGFKIIARLQHGVDLAAARRGLDLLAGQLQRQYPVEDLGNRFVVQPELRARPDIALADVMPRLAAIFVGLTGMVLLIACANVASLMLARASGRSTELAVRTALGARRGRLIRQLLTESIVLATLGGAVGLLLAAGAAHWLRSLHVASSAPAEFQVVVDWRVLSVTMAAALGAAVLSGMGPALRSSTPQLSGALREGGRGTGGGVGRQRFRAGLVVAQVAVAFVVLVAAGLFLRSVQRAGTLNLGFRQDHVFLATVDVSLGRYDRPRGRQFFQTLLMRTGQLSGVRRAALASATPLGSSHGDTDVYAALPTLTVERGHTHIETISVTPGYFDVLSIRRIAGRDFTIQDDSGAPRVMIINAATAARLWPGRDPIGQRVRFDPTGPEVQVIGVVQTVTAIFLGEKPHEMIYVPFAQRYESEMTLHLATEDDPGRLATPVRGVIASLDANLAPYAVETMSTHLRDGIAFAPIRLAATLATVIGLLGLVLAIVGLYGVVAYSVAQREREIGIRMAMGATAGDIIRSVLGHGLRLTGIGLTIGLVLSFAVAGLLRSMIIGVSAHDPTTFVGLAVLLTAATFVASLIPAWRAAMIPPATAIRTT